MPGSPEQTRATERPSAARVRAKSTALDLGTQRKIVPRLAGGGGTDQVEIEAVADQFVGFAQQLLRLARAPAQIAWSQADHRQTALRAADEARIQSRAARWRRRK